jgi:hypothetical protein
MQNRLPALLMALAVTVFSFGQSALNNTTESIAHMTETVFGDHEVVLADESYDSTYDGCYDSTGTWLCGDDDYYYEEDTKDKDEEYYYEEEYDYDDDYYYEEDEYWDEDWVEEEDSYDDDYDDECYDSAGYWICDDDTDKDEDHQEDEYLDEDYDDNKDYDDEGSYSDYDKEDYYLDFDDSYDDHYDDQSEKIEDVIGELDQMLWDLDGFLIDVYSKLSGDESTSVDESIRALEELLEGGFDLLDTMLAKTGDGLTEDELYAFWDMVDYMWETADVHIRVIEDGMGLHGGVHAQEDENYDEDYFEDYYGGDHDYDEFLKDFEFENSDDVTRYISEDLMHELVEHDAPQAQDLIISVMNNLDVLDEDVVDYLTYTAELFSVMEDMEVPDEDDPKYDGLIRLYDASFVLLTEDVREELISVWTEVRSAVEQGADESELKAFELEIEALLEENAENLILKEGIGYYDVELLEDEWYFDDVQTLSDADVIGGDKDSDGNSTGYYRPGDAITKAEMLKLVLEVSGRGESSANPADTTAIGQWYAGYVSQFENMNMSYGGDWNSAVTRREAAVWISEAMELHEKVDSYSGEFGDVSSSDVDGLHFAAVFEYGVFTGDSGTGYLRADDGMNRAEAAKAIRVAMEEVLERAAENVDNTLDAFLEEYSY